MNILSIVLAGIITENIIFARSLGMCPFLGVSKKINSAFGMGLAVTFIITLSSLVCSTVFFYVLRRLDLQYLQVVVFILIIAFLVQVLDIALKKFSPSLYGALGIYLALIATNCAVLGTANEVILHDYNLFEVLVSALSTGLGFLLALVLMAGVRERMETAKIPRFFKGFPIALIAAGIMAMAFLGFRGFSL